MGVNRPGSVPVLVLMLLAPALGAAQTASQRLERLGAGSYERALGLYPGSEIFSGGGRGRPPRAGRPWGRHPPGPPPPPTRSAKPPPAAPARGRTRSSSSTPTS